MSAAGSVRHVDRLDASRLRFVDVRGVRTRVYEAGEGEPLLLIHGGQYGSLYSLDCWSLNLESLAKRFRVIAFDRLGQGHTDPPADRGDYDVDAVLAHTAGLIDTLGLDGFHVVGHSRGGVSAVHLALDRPDAVRSVVLVDTGSVAPFDPAIPVGAFYAPFDARAPGRVPGREDVIREPEAQAIDRSWITEDFVERMTEIARLPAQAHVRAAFREVEDSVWRPSLAAWRAAHLADIDAHGLRPPTLALWGFEDRSAPRHQGLRLFERIAARTADAQFVLVGGAGHYLFRDRPNAFVDAVTGFCLRDRTEPIG